MDAPTRLRCEHLTDPLGIDEMRPRLTWEIVDPRRGARQTAYQVAAGDWDSGEVASGDPAAVYAGPPLQPRQRVEWKVRTWDAHAEASPWSEPAHFEVGLFGSGSWTAHPIRATIRGDRETGAPSPYFRREFDVEAPIDRARLYITAFGLYEASINGRAVTQDAFRPGWTDYRIRVPYQTHDVTALLRDGRNAIGAVLGDGWYCGHVAIGGRQLYGDRPALVAQLEIDGRVVVRTSRSWSWSTGPILESDNYMGESYDARLEMQGWDEPGFDDSSWQPVESAPAPLCSYVATVAPPVRRTLEVQPASVRDVSDGRRIFDMGQNMVGRVRMRVRGDQGDEVVLRHAEWLEPDGTIHTRNLGGARATDRYVLRGAAEGESYEPHFTFHGFRYVEASGPVEDITGVVLHSDADVTGEFECSNDLVNRLQSNIVWSQRGNFVDVPTDCPQRAERLGWTGDAQVFGRTAAFNMDVAAFFSKYLTDVADGQFVGGPEDGQYPMVAPRGPHVGGGFAALGGGPGWADVGIVVPWDLWEAYGDHRVLERHYASLVRWMDFLERRDAGLTPGTWTGFGDWVSLDFDPAKPLGFDDRFGGTPLALLAAAFHAHAADLMSRIATVLGRTADAATWWERFARLRAKFVQDWAPEGALTSPTQTACALALRFGLVDGDLRERVFADLVANVESKGHLVTGFVGTPHLLHALSEGGRTDLAYRLLERTEFPGWLYPVRNGATTIWERWDAWSPDKGFHPSGMNSFNHYAYGAVGDWLYRVVGGIDAAEPGYAQLVVHPRPGGSITWARTKLHTVRGIASCDWRVESGSMQVDVVVPAGSTATVRLPARGVDGVTEGGQAVDGLYVVPGAVEGEIASGRYSFTVRNPIVA